MNILDHDLVEKATPMVGYKSAQRYKARYGFVFDGMNLEGKRLLDIGCGLGSAAIWAGLAGASQVLGIEPESAGSSDGTCARFNETIEALGLDSVVAARACRLQDIAASDGPFDIVTILNVINHLDEEAVVDLHRSPRAVARYVEQLRALRKLLADGGTVVVTDCDRRNMWNDLGLHNVLMPTIEWHKHQPPAVWTRVFREAGFVLQDVRWSPMYPLGRLSTNWPLHYATISHFTMRFHAV